MKYNQTIQSNLIAREVESLRLNVQTHRASVEIKEPMANHLSQIHHDPQYHLPVGLVWRGINKDMPYLLTSDCMRQLMPRDYSLCTLVLWRSGNGTLLYLWPFGQFDPPRHCRTNWSKMSSHGIVQEMVPQPAYMLHQNEPIPRDFHYPAQDYGLPGEWPRLPTMGDLVAEAFMARIISAPTLVKLTQ